MENIFENACFDKAYKTRDGSKAIFVCERTDNSIYDLNHPYALVVEGFGEIWNYYPNGRLYKGERFETENDIVSEWKKTINEEELDKLAMLYESNHADIPPYANTATVWKLIREAYKTGYREASEK